jgi:hypothetical protein
MRRATIVVRSMRIVAYHSRLVMYQPSLDKKGDDKKVEGEEEDCSRVNSEKDENIVGSITTIKTTRRKTTPSLPKPRSG